MTNDQVNRFIHLAANAYCRRSEFDGRLPVIKHSDIIQFGGQDVVMLCIGEDVLAYYTFSPEGRLRYMSPFSMGSRSS